MIRATRHSPPAGQTAVFPTVNSATKVTLVKLQTLMLSGGGDERFSCAFSPELVSSKRVIIERHIKALGSNGHIHLEHRLKSTRIQSSHHYRDLSSSGIIDWRAAILEDGHVIGCWDFC